MTLRIDGRTVTALRIDGRNVTQVRLDGETIWPVASAGFSPASLASLRLWFDAADATTITESGGVVSQWADKSGNGLHLAAGGAFPTYIAGTPELSFSASRMKTGATGFTGGNTVFIVAQFPVTSTWQLITGGPIGASQEFAIYNTGEQMYVFQGGSVYPNTFVDDNALNLHSIIFDGAGSQHVRNGDEAGAIAVSLGSDPMSEFWLGSAAVFTSYAMTGSIREIVVCAGAIPLADREQLEGYLAHKWGLAANLPAAHPYKASAP